MPVRQQKDAKGHAVRAVYLFTGMADVASETEDKSLLDACKTLWKSITQKQMYITGGIGSTNLGEAFSVDYDLPSDTAYCETCASIGLIFFASRLLENEINGEYADIMERAFYNTVLGGMQLDGKRFFYVNPLEIVPGIAGIAQTHRHDLPERPTWFGCACCPPNVARLISSFGKYAYGENDSTSFCHLFAAGTVNFANGTVLNCETKYPYGYTITYSVKEAKQNARLAVRIPAWSKNWNLENSNKEQITPSLQNGYIYLDISKGDKYTLTLDSSPYFVFPSPKIPDLSGQAALCRGPFVYCAEGVDNKDDILSLSFDISKQPAEASSDFSSLTVPGFRQSAPDTLYTTTPPHKEPENIKMVPYYTWGNRGLNQMKVWFPY